MGHTPGPWYANQDCIEIDGPEGPRDVTLAVVLQADNAAADARLIAAAPELLAALKRLLPLWEESIGWEEDYMDMADDARAAIAKAEGRGE